MDVLDIEGKIQSLHEKAKILVNQKQPDNLIVQALMEEGIEENYAITVIENVKKDQHNRKEFRKHILMGSFITIAALLVNYLSWKSAVESGASQFFIIWGIEVIGIITIVRGFILFRK